MEMQLEMEIDGVIYIQDWYCRSCLGKWEYYVDRNGTGKNRFPNRLVILMIW